MREDKSFPHDDDDDGFIERPQPKKSLLPLVWLVIAAVGLVCVGAVLLLFERGSHRRNEAMMMEAESRQFEMRVREEKARQFEMRAMEKAPGLNDDEITRTQMVQRLIGSRLESIRDDGEWSFTTEEFVLKSGNKLLPPDLVSALLGIGRSASRIEGKWKIEEDEWMLVLSDIQGDEKAGLMEARLAISPAGRLRVNIGEGHQYNIFRKQK